MTMNVPVHTNGEQYLANALAFTGVLLFTYGIFGINSGLSYPGKWALVPVLAALLLIAAGPQAWFNRIFLMNRLAIFLGMISYPLYLWHWPILIHDEDIRGLLTCGGSPDPCCGIGDSSSLGNDRVCRK
jgi:peptidoglycan/LPS O-acetylase OafA/YrhL